MPVVVIDSNDPLAGCLIGATGGEVATVRYSYTYSLSARPPTELVRRMGRVMRVGWSAL